MKKEAYPLNKSHLLKLKNFGKKILEICKKNNVNPILYGSYMVFYYTRDKSIKINDLDFYIKEKDFAKLVKVFENHKIKINYSKKWHVLQVFNRKLKVEFDSIDFWYKGPKEFVDLDFEDIRIKALSIKSLKRIYKRALEKSDNPQRYKKKYEMLMKCTK